MNRYTAELDGQDIFFGFVNLEAPDMTVRG